MNAPYHAADPLDAATFAAVRRETIFACCKWDPQFEDVSVLCDYPIVLPRCEWVCLAALAERLAADQEFRIEPEKSPHGPVSIVMSAADQRVLVMRNGVEIGRARISVRDPDQPLGTHAFVMTADLMEVENPLVPGSRLPKWTAIAMPRHFDVAGRDLSLTASERVVIPEGFARAVHMLLAAGSTMFVTDAPILAEHMHSDFNRHQPG